MPVDTLYIETKYKFAPGNVSECQRRIVYASSQLHSEGTLKATGMEFDVT